MFLRYLLGHFPDNSLLFPVPFLGGKLQNPLTTVKSGSFWGNKPSKTKKFPVSSLLNREFVREEFALDCAHRHFQVIVICCAVVLSAIPVFPRTLARIRQSRIVQGFGETIRCGDLRPIYPNISFTLFGSAARLRLEQLF